MRRSIAFAGVVSLVCLAFAEVLVVAKAHAAPPSPEISQAFVSFRIGTALWMNPRRFEELLALFARHPGVTDEITFFQSTTHAPLPLEENQRRFALLAQRMAQARKLGLRSGINVLTTLGHHGENLSNSVGEEYGHVVDPFGAACPGTLCPNDPKVQEYVRQLYALAAAAEPDYLWIDDDVRLAGHKPIQWACFCEHCLKVFAAESGTTYTRESLWKAFREGAPDARLALRKAWLAHNRATIARLFAIVEKAVHGVKPGLPLGFMTGDRFYEGYDFDHWAEVLAGPAQAEVLWRPGGGFYEDDTTSGLAGKSHDIGRQVSLLPPAVRSIQSEIENFPYQRLRKSAHITALEAAQHIAAGSTGAAFNVLAMQDEPLDEYEPLVAELRAWRPFYDLLAQSLGRQPLVGIHAAWNKDTAAACDLEGGDWGAYGGFLFRSSPRLFELGVPIAYAPGSGCVTLLSGDNIRAFAPDEIRRILASGVLMDAAALMQLNELGYQDLTGMTVERTVDADAIEKLSNHPLNGTFAGRERDCRQSFYHQPGSVLKATDPAVQTLSGLIDYTGKESAPATMAVFENRLGGRICVVGYFPWTLIHSLPKTSQLKSVLRWLSKDTLPVYVESYHKVHVWSRPLDHGTGAFALTNSSFDPAKDLTLLVRTDQETLQVVDHSCQATVIPASGVDGPYRRFRLPTIEPWEMRLVRVGAP